MKKTEVISIGRVHLRSWLEKAEGYGTILYQVPHVARSGMSRRIRLATVIDFHNLRMKPSISYLFPGGSLDLSSAELDIVARDWGFSYRYRSFVVGGCGMDMVFSLIYELSVKAGLDLKFTNGIKREEL